MKKITNYVLVFVMLFTYFSPFFEIFDIKAEEQNVVEEVSRGKYFIGGIEDEDNYLINLKPHEKTAVTLETEEDYYIQSCSSSNYNVVETNTPEQKKCELVANSYGKVLITLYISNRDGSSVVQEYFYVDVELEKYMELVLSKMPDVIKSYDEYSIVSEYGVSYHTKNDVYEGNQRVFDFEISYDYATVENYGNHISPYTKTKKITHKYSDDINLSNIIKLDKGQKGQFYLNSFTNNYDDYIWVSENNDVVTVDQNGNYEGIGAGKTNIKLYNKKTFEYYNSEVTVIESEFDSIKDLKESLDNSEITIDVNNINNLYGNFNGETNKEYTISNYIVKLFNEKMALDMYFYNNVHNIVCDENGCDFTIQYSDIKNGYTTKNINIENLKIKYSGIHIEYIGSLSLNSEFAINYTSYLPENTEHTIIYDNEYFEQLDNGNYIAKKSGDTEITIIAEGYSDTVSINIRHPQNIYDEFNNYLANLKNIELPYSGLSFQTEEGLTYLEKILEAKIINDYPNENIKSKLIADVSCLSSNSCYVNLRENLNTFYMGSSWLKHLIYVSYTETDLETVNEIININKLLSNPFVVQIDDVIEIENSCLDSDCFSSKLIEHTNLNEIKNNSSLEINYSKLNTFEFKKLIPGGVNYLVTISKGNEILFTKEISIYSNHIVGMDSKLNKNERSNYLKKYVDEILESDTSNTLVYDNVYEINNSGHKFHLVLDQKDYVKAQSINVSKRLYELKQGDTKEILYTLYPFNATSADTKFIVEDESVATIDKNGVITAKSKGYTFVECKSGYSSIKILVTVDMGVREVLNKYLKLVRDHQIVTYETIRNYPQSIAYAIESNAQTNFYSSNTWLPLEVDVKEENGKMYAAVKYITTNYTYDYVTSDYKEITYEKKGISVDKYKYEITTGSTIDTKLFFSEGDNNNLYFSYSEEGIVNLEKDGTLTALKPGVVNIYITDKYNKYFNYIEVIVDLEKCLDNIQNYLNTNSIKVKGSSNGFNYNSLNGSISSAAHDAFYSKFSMYIPNTQTGFDCDEETLKCTYTIYKENSAEVYKKIQFNVEKVGIFLDKKTMEINLNDSIDISYTQLNDTSKVKVTSLDQDICQIIDGKIVGTGIGFCTIKYESSKYFNYQHIVVSKDRIVSGYKELLDTKLSQPIEIPLLNFDMGNVKVSEDMLMYIETELYQATIRNKVQSILGINEDYYMWPSFVSKDDFTKVEISLEPYFSFQDHKNEYYYNYDELRNERIQKEITVIPTEVDSKALELGNKLIETTKQKYNLDLFQYLKYRLSGEMYGLFEYSEFYEKLMDECPTCTYDSVSGGFGGGDGESVSEGGNFIIFKGYDPVMIFQTQITASIEVLQDIEIYTEEDYINLLKKIVKEAYLKAKKAVTPVARVSFVNNTAHTLSDDINVEIEKSFDKGSKQMVYEVTVEDIKFKAPATIKTTGDLNYTYSVTSITPNKNEITLDKGMNSIIGYTITPDKATNKEVTFKSSDESIVTVDSKGNISAKKAGEAYITITSKDGGASTKVKVIVNDKEVASTDIKLGDINCDGKINMTDIIRLRKYLAGKETINNQGLKNGDINKDGKVNMTDIIRLRKYLAGKEAL